jgi:hypothetical protein
MHEARHTAITEFLRDTGDLKLAQMLAGHADISTTANVYAHLDTHEEPQAYDVVVDAVGQAIVHAVPPRGSRRAGSTSRPTACGISPSRRSRGSAADGSRSRSRRQGSKHGANTTGAKASFVF